MPKHSGARPGGPLWLRSWGTPPGQFGITVHMGSQRRQFQPYAGAMASVWPARF